MNSSTADRRDTAPKKASIVCHPWFPKVIGLWFAALFGLCSLALAPDTLERIVTALGIDRIVPAAAPPLGQTARLLLAMGMAGVGEIVGLVIGARLAAAQRPQSVRQRESKASEQDDGDIRPALQVRAKDRNSDAPPRKPFLAIDDLGGIDDTLRRPPLASEADHEPRPFIENTALPSGEWAPAVCEAEAAAAVTTPITHPAEEARDLAVYDAPMEESFRAEPAPYVAIAPEALPDPVPFAAPAAAVAVASASLESLGVVQLSERLALALRARRERQARQAAVAPSAGLPVPDAIVSGEEPPLAVAAPHPEIPVAPSPTAPEEFSSAATPLRLAPEETDRALRAALASLQRISGAR
ncbi:MAG: hypothetical protein Q8R44_05965 [Novosphingobium sp.]|nr:hypothetical protein [Novosphingobium sp.]